MSVDMQFNTAENEI